jgi:hypothetical protein
MRASAETVGPHSEINSCRTGITLSTAMGLPKQLTVMEPKSSLPRLPMVDLFLHDGGRELSQAVSRFKEILLETLAENLPRKACHRA